MAKLWHQVARAPERKGRTLTFVGRVETEGVDHAKHFVDCDTIMFSDEASHWNALHDGWKTYRINHSEVYAVDHVSTNQAESFFSRLRRMVRGQHHHVSARYLHQYAGHAAWLEDHRRESNGELADRTLGLAMAHPVSREWKGYWQRSNA